MTLVLKELEPQVQAAVQETRERVAALLGELMKKVVAGEKVDKNTVVEDKTFDQTITQAEVDARPY